MHHSVPFNLGSKKAAAVHDLGHYATLQTKVREGLCNTDALCQNDMEDNGITNTECRGSNAMNINSNLLPTINSSKRRTLFSQSYPTAMAIGVSSRAFSESR